MAITLKHLRSIPILSSGNRKLGFVKMPVIDPATGNVLAYRLKKSPPNLLSPIDILSATPFRIVLSDRAELHAAEDLIRVQKVLEDKITIIGKPVRTESGFKLGRCIELMIDFKLSLLHGIIVKKQIFPLFPKLTLLIKHDSIIEITKKQIIVKDSLIKLPIFAKVQKLKAASPSLSASSTSSMTSQK